MVYEAKGIIETIEQRVSGTGKQYILVRVNGEGYFVWESDIVKDVKEGDNVVITHRGGDYPKATSIRKIVNEPTEEPSERISDEPSLFHKMQFRSHALISASNVSSVKEDATDVLKKAKVFYKFIVEGE